MATAFNYEPTRTGVRCLDRITEEGVLRRLKSDGVKTSDPYIDIVDSLWDWAMALQTDEEAATTFASSWASAVG